MHMVNPDIQLINLATLLNGERSCTILNLIGYSAFKNF